MTGVHQFQIIVGGPHDGQTVESVMGCAILIKDSLPDDPAYAIARSFYDAVYAPESGLKWQFSHTDMLGYKPIIDSDGLPRNVLYLGPTIW